VGHTDSERAFCWLMQELAKNHASLPTIEHLTETLRELAPTVARHGTFNFLLSNGEALWAHCSTKLHAVERAHPFSTAQLRDEALSIDFSAHTTTKDRVAVVVTEPLTTNEDWVAMKPGELAVFVDGRRLAHHSSPLA
jgi:glutamine amidotransferase